MKKHRARKPASRRQRQDSPKIEFPENTPVAVTLQYDKPRTGTSGRGPWYRYQAHEGSFFAPSGLHAALQAAGARKGQTVQVVNLGGDRWRIDGGVSGADRPSASLPVPSRSPADLSETMASALKEAGAICSQIDLNAFIGQGWTSEDVRSIGITLFIESNRGGR